MLVQLEGVGLHLIRRSWIALLENGNGDGVFVTLNDDILPGSLRSTAGNAETEVQFLAVRETLISVKATRRNKVQAGQRGPGCVMEFLLIFLPFGTGSIHDGPSIGRRPEIRKNRPAEIFRRRRTDGRMAKAKARRTAEFVGSHKIEETRFASVATVPFHVRFTSALTADNVARRVVVDGTALVTGAPLATSSREAVMSG